MTRRLRSGVVFSAAIVVLATMARAFRLRSRQTSCQTLIIIHDFAYVHRNPVFRQKPDDVSPARQPISTSACATVQPRFGWPPDKSERAGRSAETAANSSSSGLDGAPGPRTPALRRFVGIG